MTDQQLPAVRDRGNRLRTQLEAIRAADPDLPTLADVIRRFLREGIERHNQKESS